MRSSRSRSIAIRALRRTRSGPRARSPCSRSGDPAEVEAASRFCRYWAVRLARHAGQPLVGAALAATVVFFHRAILGGRIFASRDVLLVHYPLHRYWTDRVLRGEFPHWYPHDGFGPPYVAMKRAGALLLMNLLYLR